MRKKLKGVIFGIDNVIAVEGPVQKDLRQEINRLIRFLRSRDLTPVVLANRGWTRGNSDQREELRTVLKREWGDFPCYIANQNGIPHKPRKAATQYVLAEQGWDSTEVVYVGSTDADMRTAVNGQILFLNVTWYGKKTEYGIEFSSPKDIARFIDIFCLREHLWHFCITHEDLEYYALGPYSTYRTDFATYSRDAKAAAKWGGGHPEFWTKYLWSTLYFSELHKRLNYITVYPGHEAGSGNVIMEQPMHAFANCFRIKFLPNLIERHTTATKSAFARSKGEEINHLNQLNTIKINRYPSWAPGKQYKSSPLKQGKTVLIVDDFCTNGYSLEAARMFVEQTSAKAICLSWLKTINSDYLQLVGVPNLRPFDQNSITEIDSIKRHSYNEHIVDPLAPGELNNKLSEYDNWDWPFGL